MTKRFVDDYLLFQLAILSHTFSSEFYAFLKTRGMTPSRWRVLLNLSGCPGMYITQLAQHACYEQSRVTRIVDQLVSDGLVERIEGQSDRRRVRVRITDRGEQVLEPLIEAARVHEKQVLSSLADEDRSASEVDTGRVRPPSPRRHRRP